MAYVTLSTTGPTSIAVPPTYNPYLATTSESEALKSALPVSPRAELEGLNAIVSGAYVLALMRQGGDRSWHGLQLEIDGTDLTKALAAPVSLGEAMGDAYQAITITVATRHLHWLLHQKASQGKSVRLYSLVTDMENGGRARRTPIFAGTIDLLHPIRGTKLMQIVCHSLLAQLDGKPFDRTIVCDGLPWGCVIQGVGDECSFTAQPNGTSIQMGSGRCPFDATTVGEPPRGSTSGGGAGGPQERGGVAYRDVPATLLDLLTQTNLTLDDDEKLGWKSVYVTIGGTYVAADDQPPVGTVGILMWEHRRRGYLVTQGDLVDTRKVYPSEDDRKISIQIKYIASQSGMDVSTWTFPTTNDDLLTSTMQFSGSALEHIRHLAYLANWIVSEPGDGTVVFVLNSINQLAPVMWPYVANRWTDIECESPSLKRMPTGGLVVEGLNVVNNGRKLKKETTTKETKMPKARKTSGGMGGNYVRIIDRGSDDELVTVFRVETQRWYLGGTLILQLDEEYGLDNPLDFPNASGAARSAMTPSGSAEAGVGHKYSEPKLVPKRRVRWEAYYKSGIFLGFRKTVEEMENPTTHQPGKTGWDSVLMSYGPGSPPSNTGYGWLYPDEKWLTTSVELLKIKPTIWGFIADKTSQIYGLGNPSVNHEGGSGSVAMVTAGIGRMHKDEEEMILLLEEATSFQREDWEWYRVENHKRAFKKKATASAHGSIKMGPSLTGLGHQQNEITSEEIEESRLRGQPPSVDSLKDDMDRKRVGFKLLSPALLAAHGDRQIEPIRPPFLQSEEQAERIAFAEWGRRMAAKVYISAPYNAGVRKGQTIGIRDRLTDGRSLDLRAIVTSWRASLPHMAGIKPSFSIEAEADRYDLQPTLDGRAA